MTPAQRLDGYLRYGLDISLADDGRLRIRGPAEIRALAREAIIRHRPELVEYLQQTRMAA